MRAGITQPRLIDRAGIGLAVVAAVVVIARPETRRRWRETVPVRRVSIVGLGLLAVFLVALVSGVVRL